MSVDYMLLGSIDGAAPVGPLDEVRARAKAIGVDLSDRLVTVLGVRLEIDLDVERGRVACVHVTPRGPGDVAAALKKLAGAIGAVVFDAQSGRALGEPEPDLPDVADGYVLHLVSIDGGVLGDVDATWHRVARSLGASRTTSVVAGEGWTFRAELTAKNGLAQLVVLHAGWSSATARDALFDRVVEACEENGWVPFDTVRNDTLP